MRNPDPNENPSATKQWFVTQFLYSAPWKESVREYLNKLSANGVTPDEIKINENNNNLSVWYYAETEI